MQFYSSNTMLFGQMFATFCYKPLEKKFLYYWDVNSIKSYCIYVHPSSTISKSWLSCSFSLFLFKLLSDSSVFMSSQFGSLLLASSSSSLHSSLDDFVFEKIIWIIQFKSCQSIKDLPHCQVEFGLWILLTSLFWMLCFEEISESNRVATHSSDLICTFGNSLWVVLPSQ